MLGRYINTSSSYIKTASEKQSNAQMMDESIKKNWGVLVLIPLKKNLKKSLNPEVENKKQLVIYFLFKVKHGAI